MFYWQQWGSWRGQGPWRTEQHRMVFPWYFTETSFWAADLQENPPKVTRIQTHSWVQPIRNQVRDYVVLHERKMPAGAKGGKRNVNDLRRYRWNRMLSSQPPASDNKCELNVRGSFIWRRCLISRTRGAARNSRQAERRIQTAATYLIDLARKWQK